MQQVAARASSQLQPTRPASSLPAELRYHRVAGRAAVLQVRLVFGDSKGTGRGGLSICVSRRSNGGL